MFIYFYFYFFFKLACQHFTHADEKLKWKDDDALAQNTTFFKNTRIISCHLPLCLYVSLLLFEWITRRPHLAFCLSLFIFTIAPLNYLNDFILCHSLAFFRKYDMVRKWHNALRFICTMKLLRWNIFTLRPFAIRNVWHVCIVFVWEARKIVINWDYLDFNQLCSLANFIPLNSLKNKYAKL